MAKTAVKRNTKISIEKKATASQIRSAAGVTLTHKRNAERAVKKAKETARK